MGAELMGRKNTIKDLGVACFGAKQIEKLQVGDQAGASLIKRALLVFEGTHEGMFGPVTISREFLQVIVDRFNREYANPKNENDYPPFLRDHSRAVEDVLGRMLPPLVLEDWDNPRTGENVGAIFGDIRVDDPDAQTKVLSGKYSQVSISFDDDKDNLGEVFETSAVAVEAARGSQFLQKGEVKMEIVELQAKLDSANAKLKAQKNLKSANTLALKATVKSLKLNLKVAQKDAKDMGKTIVEAAQALRQGVVKSQFKEFVREGRLSKAELDKIDIKTISLLPADSLKPLLASYKARPVSQDLVQIGSQSATPLGKDKVKQLSTQDTRELIKAQKEGRPAKLSQKFAGHEDEDKKDPELADNPEEEVVDLAGMTMDDIEDSLKKLEGLGEMQTRLTDAIDKMKSTLAGLQGDDDNEDEEE